MAEIRPLRALRYNLEKAGPIENLTCPPYDIISPDQRRELLSRSGYNLIRLELPQEGKNPYQEAAHTLNLWRSEGVLQLDMEEGMYLYEEEFLSQVDRGDRRSVLGLVHRVAESSWNRSSLALERVSSWGSTTPLAKSSSRTRHTRPSTLRRSPRSTWERNSSS